MRRGREDAGGSPWSSALGELVPARASASCHSGAGVSGVGTMRALVGRPIANHGHADADDPPPFNT
jgi:hypothetical protein